MDEKARDLLQRRLETKIEQVLRGEMNEFWLQEYIKVNFRTLGFSEMSEPHPRGYDFIGVRNGKRVVIEAERVPANFLIQGHNKDEVDVLIVMAMDKTPKKLLPKTILTVDPEDLVKKTHEARKAYAIRRQAEQEANEKYYQASFMMKQLAAALSHLHTLFLEKETYEGTPEDDLLCEAAESVALQYISFYGLDKLAEKRGDKPIPRIVEIENRVPKHGIEGISESESEHLMIWLDLLRDEYSNKL